MDFDQIELKAEFAKMRRKMARIERQNQRLKLGAAAILACGVMVGLWLAKLFALDPQVVEAERFVVRDRSGSVIAELGGSDHGAELSLYGRMANAKARLVVEQEHAALVLDGAGERTSFAAP